MHWSCSDDDLMEVPSEVTFCTDDFAEYYIDDVLFQTAHTPGGGEIKAHQ